MSDIQARPIGLPIVMVAGSPYSVVQEEYALLIGSGVFIAAGILFAIEYKKSLKGNHD